MKTLLILSIGFGFALNSIGDTTNRITSYKLSNIQSSKFETKVTDKDGNITQWYQHFKDAEGKEIVEITRKTGGNWKPPYESIQFVTTFSYNTNGNVSETFEFFGNGELRHHTVYRYDEHGNYLMGDVYNSTGKPDGHEISKPEAHLYGMKK